jgi:hypothetical protein
MSHYGYVSEQLLTGELFPTRSRDRRRRGWLPGRREPRATTGFDVDRMRSHFDFPATGRVVTNNAATTQTPRELVDLYRRLSPWYESVHRGQSAASQQMTAPVRGVLRDDRHLDQRAGARARSRPTGTPPRPSTRSCTRCSPSSATATTW